VISSSLRSRLGTSTGSGRLEDAFPFAVSRDIHWLELACQEPENQPHTFDRGRIATVRSLLDDSGIKGVVHSASSVNAAEIVPGVRAAAEEYLDSFVQLTHDLGCETLIVHAGFYFSLDIEERLDALRTTLENAVRRAEKLGITLTLENMNVLPESAEIRYLGCTADEVLAILEAIDSPNLTSCVDVGHAHLLPGGAAPFIEKLAGRIGHVQLTDNDGVIDDHLALGEGTLDLPSIFTALDSAGYNGPIAIELSDRAALARSLDHLGI